MRAISPRKTTAIRYIDIFQKRFEVIQITLANSMNSFFLIKTL